MNLYFVPTGVRQKIGGLLARWLLGRSHPQDKAALMAYGYKQKGVRPGEAMTRAMTDLVFRWPARQYAAAHQGKTWLYEFDRPEEHTSELQSLMRISYAVYCWKKKL